MIPVSPGAGSRIVVSVYVLEHRPGVCAQDPTAGSGGFPVWVCQAFAALPNPSKQPAAAITPVALSLQACLSQVRCSGPGGHVLMAVKSLTCHLSCYRAAYGDGERYFSLWATQMFYF